MTHKRESIGGAVETPPMDAVYEVLANRRRRYAIHYLKQVDDRVEFGELAEQIAAWERGKSRHEVTSDERKYAYSALQQRHLPKLHDLGLVEFDKRAGRVEPTTALESIDVYAEVVGRRSVPWGVYFLGLSAVHAVLLAMVGIDVPPLSVVGDLRWSLLFVASLGVSSLVFVYDTRRMKLGENGPPPEVTRE